MAIDFTLPDELVDVRDRARAFVREEVAPREDDAVDVQEHTVDWDVVEDLRDAAREADLWAPHLPEDWGGLGLGTLGMAVLHQELGWSPLAPLALNCMAPDEGNMHTLLEFGTDAQRKRYLEPLARGDVRSCFAMTEPDGAGADATMIQTTAERDGDEWVLDGRKWFVTGARGADWGIVVARTDPDEPAHSGTSLFIVEESDPGWNVEREIPTMGHPFPGGHCEIAIDGVRVPDERMLGGEGMGFAVAQARLAGGRIAHAMRWIGMAQRAQDLAAERACERETFGKLLKERQSVRWDLADSAKDLYLARLMVLHAAWKIDEGLDHREEISMLKEWVANALHRVVDRAVQVHGGQGVSHDTPLAGFYQDARTARIYDGPDEVHQHVVAREVLEAFEEEGTTRRASEVIPE